MKHSFPFIPHQVPLLVVLQQIRAFYNEAYTERFGEVTELQIHTLWTLTAVSFICGSVLGALLAGCNSDVFGRKWSLALSQVFVVAGVVLSSLCVTAHAPEMLILGRLLFGIHSGQKRISKDLNSRIGCN